MRMQLNDFSVSVKCKHCDQHRRTSEIDHHAAGAWVKGYRQKASLTLAQVAPRLGISVSYLSELENGVKPWSADKYLAAQKAVDVAKGAK